MLPLMSTATTNSSGHVFGREMADRLRLAVLKDAKGGIVAGLPTKRPASSLTVTVT